METEKEIRNESLVNIVIYLDKLNISFKQMYDMINVLDYMDIQSIGRSVLHTIYQNKVNEVI